MGSAAQNNFDPDDIEETDPDMLTDATDGKLRT